MHDYGQLIEKIKAHDESAFNLLYNQSKNAVYAIIYAIVKQRQTTEDLMQDTYMKMVQNLYQYNGKVKFITWLLTIAKNLAIDYYRKDQHQIIVSPEDQDFRYPSHSDNTEKKLESETYLSILNDLERQIVLLKTVGDLKHHEIALIVNKPVGTVMWMYNTAIKKMRNFSEEG